MKVFEFEDTLEPLGVAVGAFLVLVAVGTLAGTPWTTNSDPAASAIQLVGVAAMVVIGVGLAWLSYVGD